MTTEATLIRWLPEAIGFPAYHSRPDANPPPKLCTLQRTGGHRESVATETVQIAIQCWAPTLAEAAEMAELLDRIMPLFAYEPEIHKVEHQSTYEFSGVNKEPRYQSTYEITVRSCI